MAFVPGQLKDEEENLAGGGAPGVSGPSIGSTPSVGGTVAGSSQVAQQNGVGGGAGTGFVNIDRYLDANKGAAGAVKSRADQALANDAGAFGTKLGDVTGQMNAAPSISDPTKLVSDVLGTTTPGSDFGNSSAPKGKTVDRGTPSADLQAKAIEAATAAVNAQYTAPLEVGYDVGNTEEAKRAKALADSQTAGKQIATDNGTLATYGTGMQAIDRAIYGSAGEAPTLGQAAAANAAEFGNQGTKSTAFATQSKGKADALAKNRDEIRGAFGAAAGKIQSDAQAKADAANEALGRAKKDIIPTAADRATWNDGSGAATAANFVDASGLNAIGKVLGDQSLMDAKAGPAFEAGHYDYNNDSPQSFDGDTAGDPVGQVPEGSVLAKPTYTTQQVANATRGLTAEQKAEYAAIRNANPDISPADAAYQARQSSDTRGNKNVGEVALSGNDTTTAGDASRAADVSKAVDGFSPQQMATYRSYTAQGMSPQEAADKVRGGGREAVSQIDAAIKQMLGMMGGA